jgi:hypothetical protein
VWPVSQAFLDQISAADSRVALRADVLSNDTVIASDLRVLSGQVQVDATAAVRRRMTATLIDATGATIPNDPTDYLSPYGYELRLWRGFHFKDGSPSELVPLGTFRLSASKTSDDGAQVISLSGSDRARSVARARFEQPYPVAAGTNYITAIQTLLQSRMPRLTFNSISTSAVTPVLLFDQASDPWAAANQMANSIGCQVFFDPMGVCIIRTEPNPAGAPLTYTYQDGVNGTMISIDNSLEDEGGFNGVVVDGESQNAPPVHSVVYDTNPQSPTFVNGPYGRVPYFIKSQYIVTQSQADEAAAAALRRELGGTEQMTLTAVPNPAHDGDDRIHATRSKVGIDGDYVIDSFSIPLQVENSMSITARKRQTT